MPVSTNRRKTNNIEHYAGEIFSIADLCRITSIPFVLKFLCFFPMVINDNGILLVCSLMFIQQGNGAQQQSSWELKTNDK